MKIKIKIFKGERWNGVIEGQLLVINETPCIIPVSNHLPSLPFDDCLTFDGHHITQEADMGKTGDCGVCERRGNRN
jgi:hypothetical protein